MFLVPYTFYYNIFLSFSTIFFFGLFVVTENEAHLRKKQRQSERLNSFMNKYKATLDKSGTGGSISGSKPLQPSLKSDMYTFTPKTSNMRINIINTSSTQNTIK